MAYYSKIFVEITDTHGLWGGESFSISCGLFFIHARAKAYSEVSLLNFAKSTLRSNNL